MDPVLAEQVVSFSVAMLVGAILWAIGAVVLRSALGLTGLLLGGILGGLLWLQIDGAFPLWIMLLACGIVVGCVSVLIYRFLLAMLLAGILSILILVASWSAFAEREEDGPPPAPLITLSSLVVGMPQLEGFDMEPPPPVESGDDMHDLLPAAARQAEAIRAAMQQRIDYLSLDWKELDATRQLIVMGSIIAGVLLGLLIATFAVKLSAILVSTVLGSLLVLGSLSRLLAMAGTPMHELVEVWVFLPLVAWALLAIIGVFLQSMLAKRAARRAEAN